jgi:hypothetical protein
LRPGKKIDEIVQRFQHFLDDIKSLEEQSAPGSPSLPGAMPNTQVAQPNAATLQPGAPAPGPAPMPGGPPPMGMAA